MKVRVANAEGAVLDWLVAAADGRKPKTVGGGTPQLPKPVMSALGDFCGAFKPSTDWAQGGPIIEREQLRTYTVFAPHGPSWCADMRSEGGSIQSWKHGPTPLIAAMRCYVARRLGEEVEVPDELLET